MKVNIMGSSTSKLKSPNDMPINNTNQEGGNKSENMKATTKPAQQVSLPHKVNNTENKTQSLETNVKKSTKSVKMVEYKDEDQKENAIAEQKRELYEDYKRATDEILLKLEDDGYGARYQISLVEISYDFLITEDRYNLLYMPAIEECISKYVEKKKIIFTSTCELCLDNPGGRFIHIIKKSLRNILNFTCYSKILSEAMCDMSNFLTFLKISLDEPPLATYVLSIIYNLASLTDKSIVPLQELKFTESVKNHLSSDNESDKLKALLIIAYIMREDETYIIEANESVIVYMLHMFKRSLRSGRVMDDNGTCWGQVTFSKGVGQLARNDGNKTMLVELGCLPLLLRQVKSSELELQKAALNSLWTLAFAEENQEKMIEEPDLIMYVAEYIRTGLDEVKSICHGILWTLRSKLAKSETYRRLGESLATKKKKRFSESRKRTNVKSEQEVNVSDVSDTKSHVMISYQWEHQQTLKQIRDRIENQKINVWMDIYNMKGSTLQAMAEAVENAEIVMICMSRKYKDSPNCRAEAEYAFELRKPIIPLIMERGYKPDGWLGMIRGSKLFYDFSGKYPFESKIEGLLKDILQKIGDIEGETTTPPNKNTMDSEELTQSSPEFAFKQLTSQQLKDWLTKYNLTGAEFENVSTEDINLLRKLRTVTPDIYFRTIEKSFKFNHVTEMTAFEKAMDNLP